MDRPEQFIEQQCFNGWFYGTRYEDLVPAPAINIGVFNISGVEQILAKTPTVEPVIGSVTLDNVLAQFYIDIV